MQHFKMGITRNYLTVSIIWIIVKYVKIKKVHPTPNVKQQMVTELRHKTEYKSKHHLQVRTVEHSRTEGGKNPSVHIILPRAARSSAACSWNRLHKNVPVRFHVELKQTLIFDIVQYVFGQ